MRGRGSGKRMNSLAQAMIERLPLSDESVDMVFTDPPYSKEYLSCYSWLFSEGSRILKPNGFMFVYAGEIWIDRIFSFLKSSELTYFWRFTHLALNGEVPFVWARSVVAHAKSIIACCKSSNGVLPKPRVGGVHGVYTGRKDKRFHHWGQDVDTARYYIDCFSGLSDLICDPFLGGGTTAVACELIRRRWIGFDVDPGALVLSTTRLADPEFRPTWNLRLPLFEEVNNE